MFQSDLYDLLKTIPDYRKAKGKIYDVTNLRFCIILGFLCDCQTAIDIVDYIEMYFDELNDLIGLKKVPSHDTISVCLRFTDWVYLSDVLDKWVKENFEQRYIEYCGRKAKHIDGKAIRAQTDRVNNGKTPYYMNSLTSGDTIDIKCQQVGEKDNEINTLPEFIKTLDIVDFIVTIDAIGTQKNVIETILEKKAHYLLPVKDNQQILREIISSEVQRLKTEKEYEELEKTDITKKGHGRIEQYTCHLIRNTSFLVNALDDLNNPFQTIGTIAIIDKITSIKENGEWQQGEKEQSIYITDLTDADPLSLLELKIAHWSIESEHWRLDVIMREDAKTNKKGNSAINSTGIRRLVMKVHKGSKDKDLTLKAFNRRCLKDLDYALEALLSHS